MTLIPKSTSGQISKKITGAVSDLYDVFVDRLKDINPLFKENETTATGAKQLIRDTEELGFDPANYKNQRQYDFMERLDRTEYEQQRFPDDVNTRGGETEYSISEPFPDAEISVSTGPINYADEQKLLREYDPFAGSHNFDDDINIGFNLRTPTDQYSNTYNMGEHLLSYYSPVENGIKSLNFGKEGLTVSTILNGIRGTVPQLSQKMEFSFGGLKNKLAELERLDPNKKYDKNFITNLYRDNALFVQATVDVGENSFTKFPTMQRQDVMNITPNSYFEINLEMTTSKGNKKIADMFKTKAGKDLDLDQKHMVIQGHLKPFSLAHVRGSTIIDPKTKKRMLLVEELQIDPKNRIFHINKGITEEINDDILDKFLDITDFPEGSKLKELQTEYGLDVDLFEYGEKEKDAILKPWLDDMNQFINNHYIKMIADNTRINKTEKEYLAELAKINTNYKILTPEMIKKYRKQGVYNTVEGSVNPIRGLNLYSTKINDLQEAKVKDPFPVTEHLSQLLQASIAYARKNNIDQIVFPSATQIQRLRTSGIISPKQTKGTGFDVIYNKGIKKYIDDFIKSSNNTIKKLEYKLDYRYKPEQLLAFQRDFAELQLQRIKNILPEEAQKKSTSLKMLETDKRNNFESFDLDTNTPIKYRHNQSAIQTFRTVMNYMDLLALNRGSAPKSFEIVSSYIDALRNKKFKKAEEIFGDVVEPDGTILPQIIPSGYNPITGQRLDGEEMKVLIKDLFADEGGLYQDFSELLFIPDPKIQAIKNAPVAENKKKIKELNTLFKKYKNLRNKRYEEIKQSRTDNPNQTPVSAEKDKKYKEYVRLRNQYKVELNTLKAIVYSTENSADEIFYSPARLALTRKLNDFSKLDADYRYPDGISKDAFEQILYRDLSREPATMIDISDFRFDPNASKARFSKGGLVQKRGLMERSIAA
tara:strand:+ start:298 stop:3096 length:2799 start_codon:yes stop_codon:yes gene_type:complete